jgi:gluconokinase
MSAAPPSVRRSFPPWFVSRERGPSHHRRTTRSLGLRKNNHRPTARRTAEHLRWPFFDGDDFHPEQNLAKMAKRQPLTDADREPWLDQLAELIEASIAAGLSAVIACSALRRAYRERLARGRREVAFVYLKGSFELIRDRLARRQGHFMPIDLLPSLETLEEPLDAVTIDIRQSPEAIVKTLDRRLEDAVEKRKGNK